MPFLIDARALMDKQSGGVTRVTKHLISAMMHTAHEETFVFATTGVKRHRHDLVHPTNSRHVHQRVPNKFLAAGTFTRWLSVDRCIPGKFNALFLPNLEMVGRPKIPYVLLVHDLSFLIEPRWFSPKTRLWHVVARAKDVILGAKALLAVSERTRHDLMTLLDIPASSIEVIPLGKTLTPGHIDALPDELVGKRYFLAMGAGDARKNTACALEAFRLLKLSPEYSDVALAICGKVPTSLPKDCYVYSRPSDALLAALMKHATTFLYPSWYEGFGLPLHETAAFGTPIISSTAGALPETAPPGSLFAPPFKPHLWTQAMRLQLHTPLSTASRLSADWKEAGEIAVDTLRRVAKNG